MLIDILAWGMTIVIALMGLQMLHDIIGDVRSDYIMKRGFFRKK